MIPGGYYIKARKIQESDIAHAPPHVREIWDLLLLRCCHTSRPHNKLQKGQLHITYHEIREALCWYVGFRKETYTITQCENAMKWLRNAGMITTMRATRGIVVTVCNYAFYQNPKNYECRTECRDECRTRAGHMPGDRQELEELKKKKKEKYIVEIVDYLNKKSEKKFRYTTKKTQASISARINEGFLVSDFKKVIDTKLEQWKNNPEMEQYLRPETLFGTKFESYLNQRKINDQQTRPPISSPESIYAND